MPVNIPLAEIARKDPFWNKVIDDVRLNEKLSGPAIVHSGVVDGDGLNTGSGENETEDPVGTESNEPVPSSTSDSDHDWIAVAAARLVVMLPVES